VAGSIPGLLFGTAVTPPDSAPWLQVTQLTRQGKATVVKTGTDWKILTLNDLESGCRACHPGSQALQRFLLDEHSRLAESLNPTEGDLLTVSPYRER
jgi:hypothetical protein